MSAHQLYHEREITFTTEIIGETLQKHPSKNVSFTVFQDSCLSMSMEVIDRVLDCCFHLEPPSHPTKSPKKHWIPH